MNLNKVNRKLYGRLYVNYTDEFAALYTSYLHTTWSLKLFYISSDPSNNLSTSRKHLVLYAGCPTIKYGRIILIIHVLVCCITSSAPILPLVHDTSSFVRSLRRAFFPIAHIELCINDGRDHTVYLRVLSRSWLSLHSFFVEIFRPLSRLGFLSEKKLPNGHRRSATHGLKFWSKTV